MFLNCFLSFLYIPGTVLGAGGIKTKTESHQRHKESWRHRHIERLSPLGMQVLDQSSVQGTMGVQCRGPLSPGLGSGKGRGGEVFPDNDV